MAGEVVTLVNHAWPLVSAAVGAYGAEVLKASEDSAADATVAWGRRILRRVFGVGRAPDALVSLAASPGDTDLQAAMRVALRKVLDGNEVLVRQVQEMLSHAAADAAINGVSNVVRNSTIEGPNIQAGVIDGDVTVTWG